MKAECSAPFTNNSEMIADRSEEQKRHEGKTHPVGADENRRTAPLGVQPRSKWRHGPVAQELEEATAVDTVLIREDARRRRFSARFGVPGVASVKTGSLKADPRPQSSRPTKQSPKQDVFPELSRGCLFSFAALPELSCLISA